MRADIELMAEPGVSKLDETASVGNLSDFPLPATGVLRVVKNFLSQVGSNAIAQIFAFFSTAYVARRLNAEGFGWIGFAQAYLAYFTLITDLGLRTIGIREVAKHHDDAPKCVSQVLGLRLALATGSMAVFLVTVVLLPKPAEFKWFVAEYGLIIYTSALLLDWAFQGLERMELVALGEILRAGSYLALVVAGLHGPSQIFRVPIFTVVSQFLPVGLLFGFFLKYYRRIRPTVNFAAWKDLLKQALPISLGGLTLQFATGLDVVLLGFLRPAAEVGYYSAAYRLAFLPTSFTTVLGFAMFPVMAQHWKLQPAKLGTITQYLTRVLVLLGLPMVIAGWFFAPSFLSMVFGRGFLPSTLSFRILLAYLFVCHLYCPFYYLLPACGKEKAFMKGMMAGAVIGLVANLILIPVYGAPGAAFAKVLAVLAILFSMYRTTCNEIVQVPLPRELLHSSFFAIPLVLLFLLTPGVWMVKLGIGLIVYCLMVAVWHRRILLELARYSRS